MDIFKPDELRKKLLRKKAQQISTILDDERRPEEDILTATCDEVFVLEQIIKIKTAEQNYLFLFDRMPKEGEIRSVLYHEAIANYHTRKLSDAFNIYRVIFPESELTRNTQSIELLIAYRNELTHQVSQFKQDTKEILEILKKVYEIQLKTLESIVGRVPVAKKSSLTTAEVAKLFEDSVRRKIRSQPTQFVVTGTDFFPKYESGVSAFVASAARPGIGYAYGSESCPRCGSFSLGRKYQNSFALGIEPDNSYSCSFCGLELTEEEMKVARKIEADDKK